jgi:hypothetical protein
MQFIALRDFAKVPLIAKHIDLGDQTRHPNAIHKGAVFNIGKRDKFKELQQEEKELVAQLILARCIADAGDPKIVKAVQDEIAADALRDENRARRDADAQKAFQAAALTDILTRIVASGTIPQHQ